MYVRVHTCAIHTYTHAYPLTLPSAKGEGKYSKINFIGLHYLHVEAARCARTVTGCARGGGIPRPVCCPQPRGDPRKGLNG
eukprot:860256-Pelagomonas_calceolata.AAC.1